MDRYKNKYRIPSTRAYWHDYNNGMYFITICTANRDHFFGEIENGEMQYTAIGDYARQIIENTHTHNTYAAIMQYVVMPNHLHLIVMIDNTDGVMNDDTDGACPVSTDRINKKMQKISHRKGYLSVTIGNMKSVITKYANENGIPFKWQPLFHDHIIRNQPEYDRIATYIENNIKNWKEDKYKG